MPHAPMDRPAPGAAQVMDGSASLHPTPTPAVPDHAREHLLAVLPRGMFVYISCTTCGWEGPARRAHASADRDGALHQLVT